MRANLAGDPASATAGICAARALAGESPSEPLHLVGNHLIVELDTTLITCRSEKVPAARNYSRYFGCRPTLAFAHHRNVIRRGTGRRRFMHRRRPRRRDPA